MILLEFIGYMSMMPIGISIVIKLTPKLTISSINTISGVGKFCFCGNQGYAGNVGWDCKIHRVCGICGNVGLMTRLSLKKVGKKSLAVTRYRGKHLLDFPPLLRVGPDSKKGVAGSGWLWYWGTSRRLAAASRIHHQ